MHRHVFICYRHDGSSANYVERLAGYLATHIIPCWYDREVVSGDRWSKVLRQQVDTCAAMIVVMTPAAEESEWIEREISRAQQQGKPVMPLLLSGQVFFRLSDLHYENVTAGRMPSESYLAALRNHLKGGYRSADAVGGHSSEQTGQQRMHSSPAGTVGTIATRVLRQFCA
ncbi:toll/interleukin-1 receptor domain-containing protein [Actinoplanes friuliensis]|uniref:TIR domain-containing protein n=1 Tax=Actinoplanes friuliensis DSM 7358 TaxID=1246995 RepID=U5VV77_9ACTN|nr:toll/interleukin-1 receptor domain-containing protein [Actinoplanes friuliensis]AGZ40707.1 hypothetical protein AFR_12105 [Actinoplanes friuliensis DSM 7358]